MFLHVKCPTCRLGIFINFFQKLIILFANKQHVIKNILANYLLI